MTKEVLRMQNITKIYPNGFVANKDVTFSVNENEIHALVGENGAGKTTLMKILFGMEEAQAGQIFINGKEEHIKDPLDSIYKGIGMVHQHFMLVPSLTVAENVTLGVEPMKNGLFDFEEAVRMTQEIADKYNFKVDARQKVSELSVGLMQKTEILKALIKGAKIIIMDEPTAVLTPQETEELFEQLELLKKNGHSIIFISHKLEEIMRITDRVTILRHGRSMGTYDTKTQTEQSISKLMVGRDVILKIEKDEPKTGDTVLSVKGLVKIDENGKKTIDDIDFNIHSGEIVGIAGVEGNGQTELSNVICGLDGYAFGDVLLNGQNIKGKSVKQIRDMGLAFIPEDRMHYGCSGNMSIKENIIADRIGSKPYSKGCFINKKYINSFVDDCIKEFEIACDNRDQPVRMLSGGNIQKVVVAREFTSGANFILANQPTRGIDIGTADMIRRTFVKKSRNNGTATLLISADLNEILECSDRLLVMHKGKIVAAFKKASGVSEEELGEYMLGVRVMSPDEMKEALL